MRIGAMIGADGTKSSIDAVVQLGKDIESAGLDHVWLANIFSYDAITALTLIGRETERATGYCSYANLSSTPYRSSAAGYDRSSGDE